MGTNRMVDNYNNLNLKYIFYNLKMTCYLFIEH